MPATDINEERRTAVEALTRSHYDNLALFICFVNDQPAAAMVAVTPHPPGDKGGKFSANRFREAAARRPRLAWRLYRHSPCRLSHPPITEALQTMPRAARLD